MTRPSRLRPCRSRFVLRLALLALLAPTGAAQFVVPEGSDFHNGSTLPLEASDDAEGLLRDLRDAVGRADERDVLAAMRALRRGPGDELVPFGPRSHVSALDLAAHSVVASGHQRLLEVVEAEARAEIDAARLARDLPALLERATRGRALPSARVAALWAARLVFERGAWWEAEALASRAGGLEGAEPLRAAAADRLARPASLDVDVDALAWAGAIPRTTRRGLPDVTPFVAGTDDGTILLVDLVGLAMYGRRGPVEHLWGTGGEGATPLVPRRLDAALAGDRLVIPYNTRLSRLTFLYSTPRTRREAGLLGYDLGSGAVDWLERWPIEDGVSRAAGPVVVDGPVAFTQVFEVGSRTRVSLAGVTLADGRRLFDTPLVEGAQISRYGGRGSLADEDDLDKRAVGCRPAVAEGVVHACTGTGVLAAVDGLTGRVLHTFSYDRLFPLEQGSYHHAYLFDTGGWAGEPVRTFGDRIVVAPPDSRYLYVLAREPGPRGHLILDDPIERLDRRDVLGLVPDPAGGASPAVVATYRRDNRDGIVVIAPGGAVLERSPALPHGEPIIGRSLLLGRRCLVPTRVGVRVFDLDDLSAEPGRLESRPGFLAVRDLFALPRGVVGSTAHDLQVWLVPD